MRYIYRPSPMEELSLRGRYTLMDEAGASQGGEQWERYQNTGSPVQNWRSEWVDGAGATLIAHTVISPEGIERLKLRRLQAGALQELTLTPMPDTILLNQGGEISEQAVPPRYGLLTPLPSLARYAFPFDLASEQAVQGTLFHLVAPASGPFTLTCSEVAFRPLGLRPFDLQGETIQGKGWELRLPGRPAQVGWFDRHGHCLGWQGEDSTLAQLSAWQPFG